ncbi:hypothetical protein OS493_030399 [Desmophyllum pertusum]|uniref:Uncharacterized protein n=1 Tax=Desmophyllum pertusum TaxID=174260 RepID=A0A9W9ZBV5_9CNID|nr:hypothetical protein OS493_030399 [Desmophyllum pertusum]
MAEAEAHYNLSLSDYLDELVPTCSQNQLPGAKKKNGLDKCTQTDSTSDDSMHSKQWMRSQYQQLLQKAPLLNCQ